MKSYPRSARAADQIQRLLSELIRLELKDPRVHMLTITDVEVSTDMSHAKVFVTTLDAPEQRKDTLAGLAHAAGFLRSALSRKLTLRTVPQLHFIYDESVERGTRLARLIDESVQEDAALAAKNERAPTDDDEPAA
jgi:ribosome-binding factor A